MAPSSPPQNNTIRSLDFDAHRTLRSRDSERSLIDDDVDFMGDVAEAIIQRDRQKMRNEVLRVISFTSAVLSW
jgi:hypothetical protein